MSFVRRKNKNATKLVKANKELDEIFVVIKRKKPQRHFYQLAAQTVLHAECFIVKLMVNATIAR